MREQERRKRNAQAIEKLMDEEQLRKTRAEKPSAADILAWPFLAMAHHRLGHHEEARRWLERLRNYQPETDTARWIEEPQRIVGRIGDSPPPFRGRSRDPLRPGLPGRPLCALREQ